MCHEDVDTSCVFTQAERTNRNLARILNLCVLLYSSLRDGRTNERKKGRKRKHFDEKYQITFAHLCAHSLEYFIEGLVAMNKIIFAEERYGPKSYHFEDDDFVDRLNNRYTIGALMIGILVITGNIQITQPINCWTPGSKESIIVC